MNILYVSLGTDVRVCLGLHTSSLIPTTTAECGWPLISRTKKLKLTKLMKRAWGHTVYVWWTQDSNPDTQPEKPVCVNPWFACQTGTRGFV